LNSATDFGQKVSSYQEDDWAPSLQIFEAYKLPTQITDRTFALSCRMPPSDLSAATSDVSLIR